MKRLGHVDHGDPMYGWLIGEVFPQLGLRVQSPDVSVYEIVASHGVYIYEVDDGGGPFRVVGKFHGSDLDPSWMFKREIDNITNFKNMGLDQGRYRIPRLLGYNQHINYVLVFEYISGKCLDLFIKDTIFLGRRGELYDALSDVAIFLHILHSRSFDNSRVNFDMEHSYFHETMNRLKQTTPLSRGEEEYLYRLADKWKENHEMWEAHSAYVHGDCTPSNFLFSNNPRLAVLDLERCRRSDPAFDTGRVAGELKHHFIMFTGDGSRAEPFISHFYKKYCSHSDSPNLFHEITRRNPFYQAITELRIAKNPWLSLRHRYVLIQEAKKCLEFIKDGK